MRALVIESWPLLREGIASALATLDVVTTQAGTSAEGLYALRSGDIGLVVVGSTPDMTIAETVTRSRQADGGAGVVVLVGLPTEGSLRPIATAGASAIITRTATLEELREAIRAVRSGGRYVSPAAVPGLLGREDEAPRVAPEMLTPKEREVVALMVAGRTNQEIAEALYVTVQTVKTHLSHIYVKLGASNRQEAARRALEAGLVA